MDRKKGRPSKEERIRRIFEGGQYKYYCRFCLTGFDRKKSLKKHVLIHTGKKPYICDYPGCKKKFRQGGHLTTHQWLHTGELPFKCSEPGCQTRYCHANRQCPKHKDAKLTKDVAGMKVKVTPKHTPEQKLWFKRYEDKKNQPKKQSRTSSKRRPEPKPACASTSNIPGRSPDQHPHHSSSSSSSSHFTEQSSTDIFPTPPYESNETTYDPDDIEEDVMVGAELLMFFKYGSDWRQTD